MRDSCRRCSLSRNRSREDSADHSRLHLRGRDCKGDQPNLPSCCECFGLLPISSEYSVDPQSIPAHILRILRRVSRSTGKIVLRLEREARRGCSTVRRAQQARTVVLGLPLRSPRLLLPGVGAAITRAMAMAGVSPSPSCLARIAPCLSPIASRCPYVALAIPPHHSTTRPRTALGALHARAHADAISDFGFATDSDRTSALATGADSVPLHPSAAPFALGFGNCARWLNPRMIRGILVAAPLVFGAPFGNGIACAAAEHSIGSSSLGLKVASFLRGSGLSDEAIVAAIASLPALELRGAIPVGYWMKLSPQHTYALAVLGNMLPVPFIALYLEKFFNYVASSSERGKKLVDKIITNTRRKAEPIEEFKWIGLMLFVAVPFPGTGAWTGAFAASILGMTFWESMSANFVGVLLAGVLVNLVVCVGIREAIFVGIALFLSSMFMWRILRFFNQKKASDA